MEKYFQKAAFIYFSGWQKAFACYPKLLPRALTIFSLFTFPLCMSWCIFWSHWNAP